jgi:TM2 domain-containing membrane protein YozV
MKILGFAKITSFRKMSSLCVQILFLIIFFYVQIYSQNIDFQSPTNIKLFADFLFCEKDYLRALEEYEKYLNTYQEDTVQFKVVLCYSLMNNQTDALLKINLIKKSSPFYEQSKMEKLKALFLQNTDTIFYTFANKLISSNTLYSNNAYRLLNTSLLLSENHLPGKDTFLIPFRSDEKFVLSNLYELKNDPPYKSEALAGIFSTFVPGAGKIYTENYGDGITAFLFTGLLTYLAYTNFDHNHPVRAWIFTGLGAGFYAGNIYGSIASAQIFNAKINFEINKGVKLFLEEKNYFAPVYEFCK